MSKNQDNLIKALQTSVMFASFSASRAVASASNTLFSDRAKVSYSNPGEGQKQKFNASITNIYCTVRGPNVLTSAQ